MSSYGRCCSSHGIISAGYLHPSGYRFVTICGHNWTVHRVVMLAFKGPPPNEQAWQVHHKDGDRANNRLDNLEYVTRSQNMLHSYACLTRRSNATALSKPVMWRRRGTEKWTLSPSGRQAAEQLGLRQSLVSAVCRGKASSREFEIQFEASPAILNGEEWRPMLDPASGDQVHKRTVSSFGRVTSTTGLIGKGSLGKSGYYCTSISCTSLPKRVVSVHRLVAFAFLGPPPCVSLTHVNHKDLDKGNNSADNLEWVSPAENASHFHDNRSINRRNGRKPVLSRAHGSTDEWNLHCSVSSAARVASAQKVTVWKCCNGRLLQTRGYEFKYAEAKSLPGEKWREVDIKLLRDDRTASRA